MCLLSGLIRPAVIAVILKRNKTLIVYSHESLMQRNDETVSAIFEDVRPGFIYFTFAGSLFHWRTIRFEKSSFQCLYSRALS